MMRNIRQQLKNMDCVDSKMRMRIIFLIVAQNSKAVLINSITIFNLYVENKLSQTNSKDKWQTEKK